MKHRAWKMAADRASVRGVVALRLCGKGQRPEQRTRCAVAHRGGRSRPQPDRVHRQRLLVAAAAAAARKITTRGLGAFLGIVRLRLD